MKISAALNSAAEILRDAEVAEFRREASSLLAFVLQREPVFLIAHPEYELTEKEASAYDEVVMRRSKREPFQYIVGRQEFYGLDFEVTPDVLIPRPETEILVEAAIKIFSERDDPTFCEIGVGSGCISVSILHAIGSVKAVGVDISKKALAVARRNAERHHVDTRSMLSEGDLFGGVRGRFDLIVSNPPYIPVAHLDSLQVEVRDYEPHTALDGGIDGLSIVKRIIDGSPGFLKPQGFLLLEIGFDQSERVNGLFDPGVWQNVEFFPDQQGILRIVKARSH